MNAILKTEDGLYQYTPFYISSYQILSDHMAKKDRVRMPSGMAGIVRYDEEPKEAIKIKPEHVIAASLAIVMVELALKFLVR